MPQVTGTVQKISSIERQTKYGPKLAWSLQVDGEWFGNGFNKPQEINEGDQVNLEYVMNGVYKNVSHITKVAGGSGAPAPSGGTSAPNKGSDVQQAIIRQNSLAHATAVVLHGAKATAKHGEMITDIIVAARCFEQYSNGTLDAMEEQETADAILAGQS